MNRSFNLVTDGWIPCIGQGNRILQLRGILDVLANAHEYRETLDESPLVTLCLHRLLLAILHRVYDGPKSVQEWENVYQRDRFDQSRLEDYFAGADETGVPLQERFDLFGKTPFLQDPSLGEEVSTKDRVPLAALAREYASTRNPTLFDHSTDTAPRRFSDGEAARLIVTRQFFALQDGRGYPQSPLSTGATILVRGKNLFETLLFNLCIYNDRRPIPRTGKDLPSWEVCDVCERNLSGYLSYLTWPYRRLLLETDGDSEPRSVTFARMKAARRPENEWLEINRDPAVLYRRDDRKGPVPIPFKKDRALWRDAHAFLDMVQSRKRRIIPGAFQLLARVGVQPRGIDVLGACSERNKIHLWRHERLPLPYGYLDSPLYRASLRDELRRAEKVAGALEGSVKCLATCMVIPVAREEYKFPWLSHYWASLEPHFYDLYLAIPKDSDRALDTWYQVLRKTAWDSLNRTIEGLGGSARSLRAAVEARQSLGARLKKILPEKEVMKNG